MLRLSKMADYAGVIVVHMVRANDETHTATSLSLALGLPKTTVAKCLKLLAKHEVLTSQRGVNGGYALARPASEISVAEIITALEGPMHITDCVHGHAGDCQIEQTCPMRGGWDRINGSIYEVLKSMTLEEMAGGVEA